MEQPLVAARPIAAKAVAAAIVSRRGAAPTGAVAAAESLAALFMFAPFPYRAGAGAGVCPFALRAAWRVLP